jgi:hypothetical protein
MAMQVERRREPTEGRTGRVVTASLAALDELDVESLGVFCWAGVRPLSGGAGFLDWRLCGALSRTLEGKVFEAHRLETLLIPVQSRLSVRRVFAFGLGPPAEASPTNLRLACRRAYEVMSQAGVTRFAVAAPAARQHPELEAAFLSALDEELPGRIELVLVSEAS